MPILWLCTQWRTRSSGPSGIDRLADHSRSSSSRRSAGPAASQPERELKHGDVDAALGGIDEDQRHFPRSSSRSARSTRASGRSNSTMPLLGPKSSRPRPRHRRPRRHSRAVPVPQPAQTLELIAVQLADHGDQCCTHQDVARSGAAAGLGTTTALIEEPVLRQCRVTVVDAAPQVGVGVDVGLLEEPLQGLRSAFRRGEGVRQGGGVAVIGAGRCSALPAA